MHRQHHDGPPRPALLFLFLLSAGLLVQACGGGNPNDPGGNSLGHVIIAPNGMTLSLGGQGNLTADATDTTGAVLPGSAVTWSSLNPSVAAVDDTGRVSGLSVGTTRVLASAQGRADTVTVVVVDLPCNAIEMVPTWHANLTYFYEDRGRVDPSADVQVIHQATIASTLALVGPPAGGIVEWAGELVPGMAPAGFVPDTAVSMSEISNDTTSDPTIFSQIQGDGPPIPTPGVDGFRLSVNLSSCTFQFVAAPSVHAVLTIEEHAVHTLPGPDEGIRTFNQDFPLGLLQDGVEPLGDWRSTHLGPWPAYWSWPSYSVLYIPVGKNAYVPSGDFGQTLFGSPPSSAGREAGSHGRTDVYYEIAPQFP